MTAFGLALQVASGVVLLAADAMQVVVNPAFRCRFALGLVNAAAFCWRVRGHLGLPRAARFAALSLASWPCVPFAGRFIADV